MKNFRYVGGPAMNGVTFRDGTQLLLHQDKIYALDETDPYVKTMLAKKDANGMPASWLLEVEDADEDETSTDEDSDVSNDADDEAPTRNSHQRQNKKGRR